MFADSERKWLQSGVVDPRGRIAKKQHKGTVAPRQAGRRELRLPRRFATTFVPEANKISSRECHVSGVSSLLRRTVRSFPSLRRPNTPFRAHIRSNEKGPSFCGFSPMRMQISLLTRLSNEGFSNGWPHRMACRPSGCPIRHKNDSPTLVWPPRKRYGTTSYVWTQSRLDRNRTQHAMNGNSVYCANVRCIFGPAGRWSQVTGVQWCISSRQRH